MYAVGPDNANYALFLDQVYKQRWDFYEPMAGRDLGRSDSLVRDDWPRST